jgi:hypothetical protein
MVRKNEEKHLPGKPEAGDAATWQLLRKFEVRNYSKLTNKSCDSEFETLRTILNFKFDFLTATSLYHHEPRTTIYGNDTTRASTRDQNNNNGGSDMTLEETGRQGKRAQEKTSLGL